MKGHFLLDSTITYLNHGSFGACPKVVFENYQQWQLELEREPVQFIINKAPIYLKKSKEALAQYLDIDAGDFFYVTNPTYAVNTIARSLKLQKGDEILSTSQEYGAMDKAWSYYCGKAGAKYVQANISLPLQSKDAFLQEFWSGYSENTKVVFINQISSATGLIFPVNEICERARELGLMTIIDGAHVVGHIDLDLQTLNPDFYTGSLHKWLLTPKGSSFLYVRKECQHLIEPFVVGWGYQSDTPGDSEFLDHHEIQGTRDISAFLAIPSALEFLMKHEWKEKAVRCRQLVINNYERFCDLLKTAPLCPVTAEFLGQMCSISINTTDAVALKDLLFKKYHIEIPVMEAQQKYYLRISVQAYNTQEDLDYLFDSLKEIISSTNLIQVGV